MNIINLTPHPLNLFKEGQMLETIPSTGIARAEETSEVVGTMNGIDVVKSTYGTVEGIPESTGDSIYVVSFIAAKALKEQGRTEDIFIPAKPVRDEDGRIIGMEALAKL